MEIQQILSSAQTTVEYFKQDILKYSYLESTVNLAKEMTDFSVPAETLDPEYADDLLSLPSPEPSLIHKKVRLWFDWRIVALLSEIRRSVDFLKSYTRAKRADYYPRLQVETEMLDLSNYLDLLEETMKKFELLMDNLATDLLGFFDDEWRYMHTSIVSKISQKGRKLWEIYLSIISLTNIIIYTLS
jgi:hypothetical protein